MFSYYQPAPAHTSFGPRSALYSPYAEYDDERSHAEYRALAYRQQQRREAEQAAFRHHRQLEHEALLRQERAAAVQRERALAYQAALEEREYREHLAAQKRELHRRQQLAAQTEAEGRAPYYHRGHPSSIRPTREPEHAFNPFEHFVKSMFRTDATAAAFQPSSPVTVPTPAPAPDTATTTEADTVEDPPELLAAESAAPTSPEAPVQDDGSVDAAATTLQRHFRAHQQRREKLRSIAALTSSLESHKADVTLPSALVFQPSPPSSTVDNSLATAPVVPKLAYSSTNASFLAYEDFLVGLLSKVDAIESAGDRIVKKARKELVRKVERELTCLDNKKDADWKREHEAAAIEGAEGDQVGESVRVAQVEEQEAGDAEMGDSSSDESGSESDVDSSHLVPLLPTSDSAPTPLDQQTPIPAPDDTATTNTVTPTLRRSASNASSEGTLADIDEAVDSILHAAAKLGGGRSLDERPQESVLVL